MISISSNITKMLLQQEKKAVDMDAPLSAEDWMAMLGHMKQNPQDPMGAVKDYMNHGTFEVIDVEGDDDIYTALEKKKTKKSSYRSKTAGPLDFLEEMTRNYSGSLPYVGGASGALTGGLVGLGVGPLVEYFREKKEKDYKKALLVGLGLGAGTGGVLGAGTGLAQKQMINSAIDAIRK